VTPPPPAFALKDLTHTYPRETTPALAGVTVDIPAGETIAVLGPSGCGKSTLLSLLGLLWDDRPGWAWAAAARRAGRKLLGRPPDAAGTTGTVSFHDGRAAHPLLTLDANAKAGLRAAAFGFVLQSSYLLPHFSCLRNVGMPLALHGWPPARRDQFAAALLRAAGTTPPPDPRPWRVDPTGDLWEARHRPPRGVSLGQRQRFAALRAVATDPTVVFADEPTSNLDPGNTRAVFDLLARWRDGTLLDGPRAEVGLPPPAAGSPRTLVLVCHDVQTARRAGDRFLLMHKGRLEALFPRAEWDDRAAQIETILGLDPGGAGRLRT